MTDWNLNQLKIWDIFSTFFAPFFRPTWKSEINGSLDNLKSQLAANS